MPTPSASQELSACVQSAESELRIALVCSMTNDQILREMWTNISSGRTYNVIAVGGGEGPARRVELVRTDNPRREFKLRIESFASKYRISTRDDVLRLRVPALEDDSEDETPPSVGFVVEPDVRHDFNRIVLHQDTIDSIKAGINKVVKREAIERAFRTSLIEPRTRRSVLNFYGEPGTGKTLSAVAVARQLGKPLFQVDYSQVISKYVGDTAKHIKSAFDEARALDAVLLWDEADALMSRRISATDGGDRSFSTSINQNRTVMMQELDRFDGVVIMSTNMFANYDPAFVRRIAQHVEFKPPTGAMLRRLYNIHLPAADRVMVDDWDTVISASEGLFGGDVLNVVLNSIGRVTVSDDESTWFITGGILVEEASKVAAAKRANL